MTFLSRQKKNMLDLQKAFGSKWQKLGAGIVTKITAWERALHIDSGMEMYRPVGISCVDIAPRRCFSGLVRKSTGDGDDRSTIEPAPVAWVTRLHRSTGGVHYTLKVINASRRFGGTYQGLDIDSHLVNPVGEDDIFHD